MEVVYMERLVHKTTWLTEGETILEQLSLWEHTEGYLAHGVLIGVKENLPVSGTYRIELTPDWRVRQVEATWSSGGHSQTLRLHSDGNGNWQGPRGLNLQLSGCIDIDIAWTPFTNTLPIRRLGLTPGESREIAVVYIAPPALEPRPLRQRYTALGEGRWRYESLASGFSAELVVDEHGLVTQYPGAFHALATWREAAQPS
jgi:hypothetical protein